MQVVSSSPCAPDITLKSSLCIIFSLIMVLVVCMAYKHAHLPHLALHQSPVAPITASAW